LILQSFNIIDRKLVIAFTCNGGPKENQAYLVTFLEATSFHLPSVLYETVQFEIVDHNKIKEIIPHISYDEGEYCDTGFKVIKIITGDKKETGYYIAAESVSAGWVPRTVCNKVW
jgi:hypothetical protein